MSDSSEIQAKTADNKSYQIPTGSTLEHCCKLAIVEDKPIMFDYWTSSCDGAVIIGVIIGVRDGKVEKNFLLKVNKMNTPPQLPAKIYGSGKE